MTTWNSIKLHPEHVAVLSHGGAFHSRYRIGSVFMPTRNSYIRLSLKKQKLDSSENKTLCHSAAYMSPIPLLLHTLNLCCGIIGHLLNGRNALRLLATNRWKMALVNMQTSKVSWPCCIMKEETAWGFTTRLVGWWIDLRLLKSFWLNQHPSNLPYFFVSTVFFTAQHYWHIRVHFNNDFSYGRPAIRSPITISP